jgi:hypothetical protein
MQQHMKAHRRYLAVIVVLVVLLAQTAWQSWQRSAELEKVYAGEVLIKTVDADNGESIPAILQGSGRGPNQRWPDYRIIATPDRSEMRVRWIDVGPLPIVVSSAGHVEQKLNLDRDSAERLVVKLSKLAVAEEGDVANRHDR